MVQSNPESLDRIREVLKNYPAGLNISRIAEESGFNRMSVAKYLEVLTAAGIVEARMAGNAKMYYLSRQIPITTHMEYTSKHYCITDDKLKVVQLNEFIPRTVGMKYEDFLGRYLPDVLKGVVVNLDECREAMDKALAGEAHTVIVEENFRGRHQFFEILHMPVQFPDGSAGMMAVSQEITDKKKLEIALREESERFRDMVENSPDIVFTTDAAGIVTYISPRVQDYGSGPADICGRPFWERLSVPDREKVMAGFFAARDHGIARGIRCRIPAAEGHGAAFVADCRARLDSAGTFAGINGILRETAGKEKAGRKKRAKKR
jgi:PAS domain S-box-containing protein